MKNRKLLSKFPSLIALFLTAAMLLTMVGFAAEASATAEVTNADSQSDLVVNVDGTLPTTMAANSDPGFPAAIITEYGVTFTSASDTIRTDWDRSGCQLDTQFLTGDYLLRRLRLTFNDAYDLYDAHIALQDQNSISTVMALTYGNSSRTLRDYLSNSTYRNCKGNDGIETLQNLKRYSEYRNNSTVRRIVDNALSDIERYYAPNIREGLAFFFPEAMLRNMSAQQLLQLSTLVVETPEYRNFHNTLYGHDCGLVRSLLNNGYSLSYIVQRYTDQAESAVATIWPDYQERMNDYWRTYRSW